MSSPEKAPKPRSAEHKTNNEAITKERLAFIEKKLETEAGKVEQDTDDIIEKARRSVSKEALSAENYKKPERSNTSEEGSYRDRTLTTKRYRQTLHELQFRMGSTQRSFSRVLHRPIVEKLSDIGAETVARPSVINGAAIISLIGVSVITIAAYRYGYEISGSALPLLLLSGAAIGIISEMLFNFARKLSRR